MPATKNSCTFGPVCSPHRNFAVKCQKFPLLRTRNESVGAAYRRTSTSGCGRTGSYATFCPPFYRPLTSSDPENLPNMWQQELEDVRRTNPEWLNFCTPHPPSSSTPPAPLPPSPPAPSSPSTPAPSSPFPASALAPGSSGYIQLEDPLALLTKLSLDNELYGESK